MTMETMKWLNTKVLIGDGTTAWHNTPELKGNEDNHYPGPIPYEDVMRRLFNFDVERCTITITRPDGRTFSTDKFFAQCPDNEDKVFGIHGDGYVGHQYRQWLVDYVQQLLGEGIGIHTAGLLKDDAVAFVTVRTPEVFKTKHGVQFYTFLLATTSFDGSIATTYKTGDIDTVCDNTREAMLSSVGNTFRIKHTKNSNSRIEDAKAALKLLEKEREAFAAECDALCERPVTEAQFQQFLSQLVPLPEIKDKDIAKRDYSTRSATIAANKRERLNELYRLDGRVAPWQGTWYGVLQMVNTYNQHDATQRGATDGRFARTLENMVFGKSAQADLNALKLLEKVAA